MNKIYVLPPGRMPMKHALGTIYASAVTALVITLVNYFSINLWYVHAIALFLAASVSVLVPLVYLNTATLTSIHSTVTPAELERVVRAFEQRKRVAAQQASAAQPPADPRVVSEIAQAQPAEDPWNEFNRPS